MPYQKLAALTFDDGPNPDVTVPLLDILLEARIPASFFLVGENITPLTVPVIERAAKQGCEICNHSFSHPDMTGLTPDEIRREVSVTSERIRQITGTAPRFFRPPYIAVSEEMFGLIPMPFIAGFGCDDFDPEVRTAERITRTMAQLRDGAVILLHDAKGNRQTVDAVRALIPMIRAEGYEFVTVSELFSRKQITPRSHIVYSYAEQTTMYAETE